MAEQRANRSFAVDSLASFALLVLTNLVRLPTNILIARFLGPAGKGVVTLLQLLVGQAGSFLSLGLDTALVHFVGRRNRPVQELAGRALGLGLVLGAAGFAVLVALLVTAFDELIPAEVRLVALLLAATVPLSLSTAFLRALIRACGRIIEEWFLLFLTALATLICVTAGLLLEGGVRGVLWGLLAATLLSGLFSLGLAWRLRILGRRPSLEWSGSKPLVGYGIKLHAGNILEALNDRFDMYIVAFFLGTAAVGIYSIAVVVAELLWFFPGVLSSVLMQRVAVRSEESANTMMGPVLRMTSLVLACGSLAWVLAGGWVIGLLFGEAFLPAYWPLVFLLPGTWGLGLWKTIMTDLSVRGYPLYKTYTAGVAVVLTVVLDFLLIPRWGVPGAAVASSVAYVAAFVLGVWLYCRVTSFQARDILLPRGADFALAWDKLRAALLERRAFSLR